MTEGYENRNGLKYLSEYLSRIKSVAISIQLPEGYDIIKLSFKDTERAIVHFRDCDGGEHSEPVLLAEEISYSVTQTDQPVGETTNTISFRLPAVPNEKKGHASSFFGTSKVVTPWSAREFSTHSESVDIACAQCGQILVTHNPSRNWKQLPSENWAEMMDFWHCHKPEKKKDGTNGISDHDQHNPGYAISRFVPTETINFVGLTYFLINPESTTPDSVSYTKNSYAYCNSCNTDLGLNENGDTLKLFKWSLNLNTSTQEDEKGIASSYPDYIYVSAIIADLIDSHAIYTFSVKKEDEPVDKGTSLLVWIFNPHIQFTNSAIKRKNGFKVFYSTDKEKIPSLMQMRADVEPILLPSRVYKNYVAHLEYNTSLLPENYRWFGDWKAGIAEKL